MPCGRPSTADVNASAHGRIAEPIDARSLRVAHSVALGGIRAGVPLGADAGLPKRGAGCLSRFPNPPGGSVAGVNPIKRSTECASY